MYCRKCGAPIEDTVPVCPSCGIHLAEADAHTILDEPKHHRSKVNRGLAIAVVFVIILSAGAAALLAGAFSEGRESIVGRWDGMAGSFDDEPRLMSSREFYLDVKEDKTFNLSIYTASYDGTWTIVDEDEEDGTLYLFSPDDLEVKRFVGSLAQDGDGGVRFILMTEDSNVWLAFIRSE